VKVNDAAVVSAVQAYAKINARGQWMDRSETVNLNKLFDRMTRDELEIYSYNDHRSAPFSRACWLALAPPTLLGRGSRHCHGINFTH
jgi:hypothetical protein